MYGENTHIIREQLSILLRQHRIQHRIGGAGIPTLPVTTTPVQRRLTGLQIARYRHAVLVWAFEATRAIDPRPDLDPNTRTRRDPLTNMAARLHDAVHESRPRPSLAELHETQRYSMLAAWQQAARAATLGEHDFGTDISAAALTRRQARTILKDAATITRALIVLDHRYATIPGWQPLANAGRLIQAADDCIDLANTHGIDLTVDLRGWRKNPIPIAGTGEPGIVGILQAQHNLLTSLDTIPDTRNLRRIIESQLLLSGAIAALTDTTSGLHQSARRRVQTYLRLQKLTRELVDITTPTGRAGSDAHAAAVRASHLTATDLDDPARLEQLVRSFDRLDDRISHLIATGARQRLYLQRTPLPQIDLNAAALVKPQAASYVPLCGDIDAELVVYARTVLRPRRPRRQVPPTSQHSRTQLEAAINHRPGTDDPRQTLAL